MTALDMRGADEDVLVHDLARRKVHVLNATAGHVLSLCDGEHSLDDIATSICAATGADRATVERDVASIVATFTELELVVP